jgi:hypothetical protein
MLLTVRTAFRSTGIGRLGTALTSVIVLALMTACGASPSTSAPPLATETNAIPPAPAGLHAVVSGTTALVTWQAPDKAHAPLRGYEFYLDETPPVALGAQERSRKLTHLATGHKYLVQVVALTSDDQSLPSGTTFSTAFVEPKSSTPTTQPTAPSIANPTKTTPEPPSRPVASRPATGAAHAARTHTITGTLTLLERRNYDEPCDGHDAYADIYTGQKMVARGSAGQIVGIGVLGTGRIVDSQDDSELGEPSGTFVTYHCRFSFSIQQVPEKDFYSITTSTREGGPIYSLADMQAKNWRIQATIGEDS